MKLYFIGFLLLGIIFTGCSLFLNLERIEAEADAAYDADRYEEAYELYKSLIDAQSSKNKQADGKTLQQAGLLAYKLDKNSESINYLEKARQKNGINDKGLIVLTKQYRQIDNLSLEIRTLNAYVNNFPEAENIKEMRERYFTTLAESRNWERAIEVWADLHEDSYQNEGLMEGYLLVNRELHNEKIADETAEKLLELNNLNTLALEHLAKKYYNKGIERYNHEMRAYQENRTHRQYAQLMDAWPVIHSDLRISRNYFLKLYDMEPTVEYARFLANIYERFNDDNKARYYRQRSEQ